MASTIFTIGLVIVILGTLYTTGIVKVRFRKDSKLSRFSTLDDADFSRRCADVARRARELNRGR